MELSTEQQLEKEKWTTAITKQYQKNIAVFSRTMVHELPQDTRVILTAYGIDHESLFYWAMEDFLEERARALQNRIDPDQPTLFDYNRETKDESVTNES